MADDRVLELWRTQEAEGFRMAPDEIRRRSEQMDRKLRRMTWDFAAVFALASIVVVAMASVAPTLPQTIGAALTVVAFGWMAVEVRRLREPNEATRPAVEFHRAQLRRQLEFSAARRVWMRMLVLAPGPLLFFASFAQAHPRLAPIMIVQMVTFVVALVAAVPLARRRRLAVQRQLDELERLAV